MIYGWAGTDLEIDLSQGKIEKKEGDRKLYQTYLGPRGTDLKKLWDRVPPEVDPFSPDNLLIVGAGVLDGTIVPGANRSTVIFKSPVTEFLAYTDMGGYFGPELKYAGYDTIAISGKSPTPVYLWINDDTVEIRDASHLWGKDTRETQTIIREELNEKAQILCIGQAGENKVYSASIEHGLGVSASRRGGGLVMGDKNLKAIAVYGTKDINIAKPSKLYELCEQILNRTGPWLERWDKNPGFELNLHLRQGAFGWYRDTVSPEIVERVENWRKIGEEFKARMIRRVGCHNCPLRCREEYRCADGTYCGLKCGVYAKPMIAMQIFDGAACTEFYNLCEKYGLDYQGPVNLVAFAIDLYEKGILTKEDTDGMHLEYGNADVALSLIKKIAFREGIGDVLADGLYRAAHRIGKGAEEYAVTTKKLEVRNEFRFYDYGQALSGAVGDKVDTDRMTAVFPFTSNIPNGDKEAYIKSEFWGHPKELEGYFLNGYDETGPDHEARVQIMSYSDEQYALCDALGLCQWWTGKWGIPPPITGRAMFADLISYATGLDIDEAELTRIAKRNISLIRSYNVREGLRRKDDAIPEYAFTKEPPEHFKILKNKNAKKLDRDLCNKQIDRWYQLKGWDNDGIPTKETLKELGMDYVYQELERRGITAIPTPISV